MVSDLTIAGSAMLLTAGLILQATATRSFQEFDGVARAMQFIEWGQLLIVAGVIVSAIAWGIREFDVLE